MRIKHNVGLPAYALASFTLLSAVPAVGGHL